MKRLTIFFAVLCCVLLAQAQEKKITIEAGQLGEALSNSEPFSALCIEGSIDARDFEWLGSHALSLSAIDLSGCEIVAFDSSNTMVLGLQSHFNAHEVPASAFFGFTALKRVVLPASITAIGDGAFAGCAMLAEVGGGVAIETIGDFAFSGCSALAVPPFPAGLKHIGDYAFDKCEAIGSIDLTHCTQLTYIGERAFAHNGQLVSLKLPTSLRVVGNGAFAACTALVHIEMPCAMCRLGEATFAACTALQSVDLSNTALESLPAWIFANCHKLNNILLPATIASIDEGAFYYCEALPAIELPSSTRVLDAFAFAGCSGLKEITFMPEGVESIERYAFYHNESSSEVVIPTTVDYIGDHAFEGCYNASKFHSYREIPASLGELVFANMEVEKKSLIVAENCEMVYQSTDQWRSFGNITSSASVNDIVVRNDLQAHFEQYNLVVTAALDIVEVRLYDMNGMLLAHATPHTHQTILNTQPFAGNIYLLQVTTTDGCQAVTKVARVIK